MSTSIDATEAANALLVSCEELESCLERERNALGSRDFEALTDAVLRKRSLLGRIAELLAQKDLNDWLREANDSRETKIAIVERLKRCRILNETSGGAIAALKHDTQTALSILGIETTPARYEESGSCSKSTPNRSLGVC